MLHVQDLTVAYTETPVFERLGVDFEAGQITGIIGPNGAGKSTLIKAMLGLINAKSGTTTFNGQPLKLTRHTGQPATVAYVEQRKDLDLSFPIDVLTTVMTGTYGRLGLLKGPDTEAKTAAVTALAAVGLTGFGPRQIGQLSGGQLQRVFVARAMVQDADLIILDEPFVGIDLQSETAIMRILHQWRDAGKTILVVHHDLNKVTRYFDSLVILNHGIVAAGPTATTYTAENMAKAFSADLSAVLFDQEVDHA